MEPNPHYCTSATRAEGDCLGCPLWPACLIADTAATQPVESTLARDLVSLLGIAAGAAVFLAVAALLLPLFV